MDTIMKDILNRIAFNIGYAYGYIKIRCKLINKERQHDKTNN